MIDTLASWYPGHRVLEFFVIVAAAATLVSAIAWVGSLCLGRHPVARHAVLLPGLLASLASPLFALAFTATGRSLINVPLLVADRATAPPSLAEASRAGEVPGLNGRGNSARGNADTVNHRPNLENAAAAKNDRYGRDSTADSTVLLRSAAVAAMLTWLCGALVGAISLVRSVLFLFRLRRSVQSLCDPAVDRALIAARTLLKAKRATTVGVSPLARAPMATGFVRPTVVLPTTLISSISPEQLCDVLVHEVAHIERRDNFVALAQVIARILFWPIPLVHLLNRQLERAREQICDNYVLARSDAVTYGETLLRVAQLVCRGSMPVATAGILHWRGTLEDRIAGIIDRRRDKMTRMNSLCAIAVSVAFLSGSAILCGTTIVQAADNDRPAKTSGEPESASTAPAAAEAGTTKAQHDKPTPNEERAREKALDALGRVYALQPREVLKCVSPPFPSERDAYLDSVYPQIPQASQSLDGYIWMNFTWSDRLKYKNGVVHSAPAGLGRRVLDVMTGLLDCPEQEIEGPEAIVTKGIAADFIALDQASPEQIAATLAEILKEKFKLPVKISIQDNEREVFVVKGKYKPGAERIEVYGFKVIDQNEGGGGDGSFREMLGHVGDWIKCRIVAEVEDAPKQVSWHFNWRPPFSKELLAQDQNPESVMKHLGEQTGLTVSKERRKVRVFRVEATKSE